MEQYATLEPTAQLVAITHTGAIAGGSGGAEGATGPRSDSQVLALLDNIMTDTEMRLASGHRGNRSSLDSEEAAAQLAAGAPLSMALPRAAAKAELEAAALVKPVAPALVAGVQQAEGKLTAAAKGLRSQEAAAAACTSRPGNAGSDKQQRWHLMKGQRKGVEGRRGSNDHAAVDLDSNEDLQLADDDKSELDAAAAKHHQAASRTGPAAAAASVLQQTAHAGPGAAAGSQGDNPPTATRGSMRAVRKPPASTKAKDDIQQVRGCHCHLGLSAVALQCNSRQ